MSLAGSSELALLCSPISGALSPRTLASLLGPRGFSSKLPTVQNSEGPLHPVLCLLVDTGRPGHLYCRCHLSAQHPACDQTQVLALRSETPGHTTSDVTAADMSRTLMLESQNR